MAVLSCFAARRNHALELFRPQRWSADGGGADLFVARRKFQSGSILSSFSLALTGALAGFYLGCSDRHDFKRSRDDGSESCASASPREFGARGDFSRAHLQEGMAPLKAAWEAGRPSPSRAHDRSSDDNRHGADGARSGRRRRTKCATWPRRHWRSCARHGATPLFRAIVFSILHRKVPVPKTKRI